MMHKKIILSIAFLLLSLVSLQAQQTTTTAGGEAIGGGSASYTVGQVFYTAEQGTNGNSIAQGVQQPYEISVVIGVAEAKDISLSFSAYPNPTADYLSIKVENYKTDHLQYQVYDINGKLLQTIKATGQETNINIQDYPVANYFVKVLDNSREIKIFKIIKN